MARLQKAYAEQTQDQEVEMLMALISTHKGKQFDCIQLMRYFKMEYGIDEDHHLYSIILDHLHTTKKAQIVQPGGYTVYKIL